MGRRGWDPNRDRARRYRKSAVLLSPGPLADGRTIVSDLAFSSAVELAQLVKRREVSPVELVQTFLDRIDKLDGELNSFVTVVGDQALEAAREAEQEVTAGGELPPFHGVPITIKDLQETAGIRTTLSNSALAEHIPTTDQHPIRRIREAGFIILGKTNTSEFGSVPVTESRLNGICRNPWDTNRTPGGSSGGAAASLAAGLTPISQGADGGGSIRIPSSCCGLFGIKPSRGRVSVGPRLGENWHGFSVIGPIARSVEDAAALLDVMSGYETGDPYWAPPPERPFAAEAGADPGKLRIGYTATSPNEVPADPIVVEAMEDAARLLASLGHEVEEAAPDWVDPELAPSFVQLIASGTAVLDFLGPESMEPLNAHLLQMAREMSAVDHMNALSKAHAFSRRVVAFWDTYDVLLTPTLALPPLPVGWIFEESDPFMQLLRSGMFIPFTPTANVTGQPAVSVPLTWSDDGLPIGVQLVGAPGGEAELIRLSSQLEEARPWADRRPPVS
jgi:amidase